MATLPCPAPAVGRHASVGRHVSAPSPAAVLSVLHFKPDLLDRDREPWRERAACKDTDVEAYYPEVGGDAKAAKRVCSGCQVRVTCLQDAIDKNELFGIWGGLSRKQRRAYVRKHGPVVSPATLPAAAA